ncbi:MAG: FKBP-type peptidyl-prolyl cis-trans isomerase [Candidatus Saccharimonadales bacterium]
MAKLGQRFFAIFFAALFLITSSSVAVAFILANVENKNNKGSSTSQTKATSSTSASSIQNRIMPNFTPVASVTTLQIKDISIGNGPTVKAGSTISVLYTGAVAATGIIFQSASSPISLSLNNVIPGWQQGIPGMKVGGTRELLIPANLAYGQNPPAGSGIPPNAALVFDVTVKAIQ